MITYAIPTTNTALTKVVPGEDTLHRVVSGVARGGGASLIARRAEVIIVTYQTLVPAPTEVGLQACITAYTCNIRAYLALHCMALIYPSNNIIIQSKPQDTKLAIYQW